MAMFGRSRVSVVVVVPALTVGQDRKQPVVATVFARFVIAVLR